MGFKIGIDVGGTFTDLFLWSSEGDVETFKVLSTPKDPSVGVLDGLSSLAAARDLSLEAFASQIQVIVHGTTVATNAVLTRNGARTGLITTEGVRDALEMRRGIREKQYDNTYTNVVPLVPRRRRLPVRGRLDYRGDELQPLDLEQVRAASDQLAADKVDAVAICFMNAFSNPAHERAALELVRKRLPDAYVSASADVLPIIRFYNRLSTTVLNAYVGPVLRDYLQSLTSKLEQISFGGVLLIMQSNGGVARPGIIAKWPATTLLSGPAAGPCAAIAFTEPRAGEGRSSSAAPAHGGRESNGGDCILVDMGGTSFDASLVRDGRAAMTMEGEIARLRIALPMLGIATIGAGGGSIGWIDEGGLLRMGPQSAGALPGPACYGRGGTRPTCTDANLVLGYLNPEFFAGGKLQLDDDAARRAIEQEIATPLALDLEEAAAGMYRVINANMAHGVREITVKRGLDPREFPLVVAGGAGSLHACMIADELEIPSLIVPSVASILCAVGMLLSDLQHDFVRSYITRFSRLDRQRLRRLVAEMMAEGAEQLQQEGVERARVQHQVALDLRYLKQYHEVTLPVAAEAVEGDDIEAIARSFHGEHNRLYGYDLGEEGTDLELISVRVRSLGKTEKPTLPRFPRGGADPERALTSHRRAFVPESGAFQRLAVYDGHKLQAGNEINGPALIERTDTSIFISASYGASIDDHGSCHLRRREG